LRLRRIVTAALGPTEHVPIERDALEPQVQAEQIRAGIPKRW
jgi:hypothetical protein